MVTAQVTYYDPIQLPKNILVDELSRYMSLSAIRNMLLVNRSWSHIFGGGDYLGGVLKNYSLLSDKEIEDCKLKGELKFSNICRLVLQKNICEGRFEIESIDLNTWIYLRVKSARRYQNDVVMLCDNSLFHLNSKKSIRKIPFQDPIISYTVKKDKIFALTNNQICHVKIDGSFSTLFNLASEIKINPDLQFFDCLDDFFVLASNSTISLLNQSGTLIANIQISTQTNTDIKAMTIFENCIVIGKESGNIAFYDKELTCVKFYGDPKADGEIVKPIYTLSRLKNQLVAASLTKTIIWSSNIENKTIFQGVESRSQLDIINNNLTLIKGSEVRVLMEDDTLKAIYSDSNRLSSLFTLCDKIIIQGVGVDNKSFMKALDFASHLNNL
ncbi:MAG: hypothetical protein JHC93_07685 [Parachlamydiales bacterium]|nr:hypothetical protein [Parachlamydiales bacterium]